MFPDLSKNIYGEPRVVLMKMLASVKKIGHLWKLNDPQYLMEGLVNLINVILDLIKL